ncbi:hypothetical protein V9T40_012665 [Parthenolecanium corni]|uniref:Uncharacterized protein n=1 Tax=Parthenolecanium corni TaxID=536013 RepID=A0AAN9XZM7_9HEMI
MKSNNILYVYMIAVSLGVFVASAYVSGIQIGIEILYPISEDKCSAVMIFVAQSFACIFLAIYGVILRNYGDIVANSFVCIFTFAGAVVCFFGPVQLNRQEAEQAGKVKDTEECQQMVNLKVAKH